MLSVIQPHGRRPSSRICAADIYTRARARGASHTHATRILGRASCPVIWRLWHDHDTYNPNATPPYNTSSQPKVDTGGL